ncbi:hypothetical protein [Burkholderia plantarii]|nr:hypothetical protein [Burkholderia plantarii]
MAPTANVPDGPGSRERSTVTMSGAPVAAFIGRAGAPTGMSST